MRRLPIREFAKASIVDLVVRQLKRSNPELIPADAVDPIRSSAVPAAFKRDILSRVWREAGPETLLSVGQGVRDVGYDPIWHAAVRTPSPAVVFDKWRRFEVFGHSRNRLRIDQIDERRASFQRYTVDGGTPTAPENLLICGLIIALLEEIGCVDLRCEMLLDGGATHCLREDGRFSLPDDASALVTTGWTIGWKRFLSRVESRQSKAKPPDIALPLSCDSATRTSVETVIRLLSFDVARQRQVGELAREAGLSKRSLQRRLGDAGLTFSHLVRLVRIHEACRLLEDSDAPVTAIGFCAGFSDSAHFSRDFRASMGMPPSEYRAIC